MLDEKKIAQVMQDYVDAVGGDDVDKVLDLYTDDAVVEDPVGSEPYIGREGLRTFYQTAVDSVEKMVLEGNVRAREKWGACGMLAYPKGMDLQYAMETMDVMEFNDEGKITRMTAYWGDSNLRKV